MPTTNARIVDMFTRIAELLEFEGANPFRIRAYQQAARTVGALDQDVATMVASGADLTLLPGIGDDLAQKIRTIVETGTLPMLEQLEKEIPRGLAEVLRVPGLGAKRAMEIYRALGVQDVAGLIAAAEAGKIARLPGFGPRSEEKILKGARDVTSWGRRFLRPQMEGLAGALLAHLQAHDSTGRFVVAGSYRRRKETVGDLDIVATGADPAALAEAVTSYPGVRDVVERGKTRITVRLAVGVQVDVRIVPKESFGAALVYFTGSKDHNIALRRRALKQGMSLNEYGLTKEGGPVPTRDEEEVYARLGFAWVPPELREDRGELEAARQDALPGSVTIDDIRGDLHSHTDRTDGRDSLESMVAAAQAMGREYLAITDHSQRVQMATGMGPERFAEQWDEIDALNERMDHFTVLRGAEVDILKDGSLDLPDETLARFDCVVASVHYDRDMDEDTMTERILTAMASPYVHILGHPRGRRLQKRAPLKFDLDRLIEASVRDGWSFEIDGQPDRLDLPDDEARRAKEAGATFSVSSDAHSTGSLDYIRYSVEVARRAWLEPDDIINTYPIDRLMETLRRP